MEVTVLKEQEYRTTDWSGGKTTQIYMYPEDGDYGKRQFMARISSATVELPESHFTKLEGVERFLTILEGEMKLTHTGIRQLDMKPYEVDRFMGDWDTVSVGKVRDFNLMLKDGAKGKMECAEVAPHASVVLRPEAEGNCQVLIYAAQGNGRMCGCQVNTSETLLVRSYQKEKISVENVGDTALKLVICTIMIPAV
ncbi:MAG: HutD family protein [Lachnospiraceae bacterium]